MGLAAHPQPLLGLQAPSPPLPGARLPAGLSLDRWAGPYLGETPGRPVTSSGPCRAVTPHVTNCKLRGLCSFAVSLSFLSFPGIYCVSLKGF